MPISDSHCDATKAVTSAQQDCELSPFIDEFPGIVFIKNHQHQLVYANRYLANEILCAKQEEVIGKRDDEFFEPSQSASFYEMNEVFFKMKSSSSFETHLTSANGKIGRYLFSIKVVEHNRQLFLLGIGHNLTEEPSPEAQKHHSELEIFTMLRTNLLGEFSRMVSHQVNQPLSAISIYIQGALRKNQQNDLSAEETRHLLENIEKQCAQIHQVTQSFNIFCESDSCQLETCRIQSILQEVTKLIAPLADQQQIKLIPNIELNLPEIVTDKALLKQVLLNILQNAIEVLSLEGSPNPRIELRATREEENIQLCIRDNGPGISNKHLDQVFEHNFTTKKKAQGSGLGLSICKTFVERFGGKIYINTNYKDGAEFVILLKPHGSPFNSES